MFDSRVFSLAFVLLFLIPRVAANRLRIRKKRAPDGGDTENYVFRERGLEENKSENELFEGVAANRLRIRKKTAPDGGDTERGLEENKSENELFEGDIVPDYVDIKAEYGATVVTELQEKGIFPDTPPLDDLQPDRRWSDRFDDVVEVPYLISSQYSPSEKNAIEDALYDIERRSGVVRFVIRSNQADYINFENGSTCSSYVGKFGGPQRVTLNRGGCINAGIIQHEILHALGFWHEQSRPDRDDYVKIVWKNIEQDRDYNFEKRTDSSTLGSHYDYNSVMHYSAYAFSKNGQKTIESPKTIGQRDGADSEDIVQLRLLYQCRSGPRRRWQYVAEACTSDCKCWEGASGCNGRDNACQGNMVCSVNTCTKSNLAKLFCATSHNKLYMRDPVPRDIGWTHIGHANDVVAMTALSGKLYCVTKSNKLYMRDPVPHDIGWKHIGHAYDVVAMTALSGKLYCATKSNKLYMRDPVPRDIGWTHIGHANDVVAMTALGGKLYCATKSNKLYMRDPVPHDIGWTHIGHAYDLVAMAAII